MKVTLVQATQNSKELITNAATLYNLGHHSVL